MVVKLGVSWKAGADEASYQEASYAGDVICIGRDQSCDLVLVESVVSRRHARIVREGELYLIEDTESAFGTRVNGVSLPPGEKRLLNESDLIAIGPYDVQFNRVMQDSSDEADYPDTRLFIQNHLQDFASKKEPFIRIMSGKLEGSRFEIKNAQELIVGRELSTDIQLEDELVSRRHAKLRRDWSGTYIEDLKSRNGLQVNGVKVESQVLKNRDQIEIGGTRLLFVDPLELPDSPPKPELGDPFSIALEEKEGEKEEEEERKADNASAEAQASDEDGSSAEKSSLETGESGYSADSRSSNEGDGGFINEVDVGTTSPSSTTASQSALGLEDWKSIIVWTLLGLVMLVSVAALIASFFVG
jgi:pSer/pThr/pTyr-binding forkhead associated (FHA) protein